nr:immunoglobulin heavy chain junction region [Macaca mulatta]
CTRGMNTVMNDVW